MSQESFKADVPEESRAAFLRGMARGTAQEQPRAEQPFKADVSEELRVAFLRGMARELGE